MSIEPACSSGVYNNSQRPAFPDPALFHGLQLPAAAPSSRSTTVIDQLGSNRRSSADNVALMIPVPTSTASTFEVALACGPDTSSFALDRACRSPDYLGRF